jgi:hypothetical protein
MLSIIQYKSLSSLVLSHSQEWGTFPYVKNVSHETARRLSTMIPLVKMAGNTLDFISYNNIATTLILRISISRQFPCVHLSRKYINTIDNKLFTNTVNKNANMTSFKRFCLLEIFNFAWHENIKHVTSHCKITIFAPRWSLALVCCRWLARHLYGPFSVFIEGENYFWHADKRSHKKPGFLILYLLLFGITIERQVIA